MALADNDNPAAPAHFAAMDAYWRQIGDVDSHVISYMLNPMFTGAPAWPNTRQAYRVVRTATTVIIASDGMADPEGRDGTSHPGFGCEVFIETPELSGGSFDEIQRSQYFQLIENHAQNVAARGGISDAIQDYGVLSSELPVDFEPGPMVTDTGSVGCLIGLPAGRPSVVGAPLGRVDIVALTIISPADLDAIIDGGRQAREHLVAARLAEGPGHLSFLAPRAV